MPDEKYVSVDIFRATLRSQARMFAAVMELTLATRAAITDNKILTNREMEDAVRRVHNSPMAQKWREALGNSEQSIEDILQDFEGPMQ
jgi:hypothetical protein